MRITFVETAATPIACYRRGKTYDVDEDFAHDALRYGLAVFGEEYEEPDADPEPESVAFPTGVVTRVQFDAPVAAKPKRKAKGEK